MTGPQGEFFRQETVRHGEHTSVRYAPQMTGIHDTRTHEERFQAFHVANPHVYDELAGLARLAYKRGMDRWSINGLFEVLRWTRLETTGDDFKLNNNYRAYYARLIMEREPELAGFFETRGQVTLDVEVAG